MKRIFQRKRESFPCENCGFYVVGNGYTNHCPKCLYSKHVDIYPGDRRASCGGLMVPVAVEVRSGKYSVVQKCGLCGFMRRNRQAQQDDMEAYIELSRYCASKRFL